MINPNTSEFFNLVFSINQHFYELIYNDEWFRDVFRNITQEVITVIPTIRAVE
jgi:hypothetical protein